MEHVVDGRPRRCVDGDPVAKELELAADSERRDAGFNTNIGAVR